MNKPDFRPLLVSLIVNIGLPAIAIQVLLRMGVPILQAIVASSVFPLAELAHTLWHKHRADIVSVLSLIFLIASAVLALLGNDPRLVLVRDSALTSVAGLVFLASLMRPRPLIYQLSRTATPGASDAQWEARWEMQPGFRRAMRLLTIVWGCGLLVDSLLRVCAALVLAPAITVVVSPLIACAVFGALILYTIRYARNAQSPGGPVPGPSA